MTHTQTPRALLQRRGEAGKKKFCFSNISLVDEREKKKWCGYGCMQQ